jgi:nucleotide-binding universal stress UspA family protein
MCSEAFMPWKPIVVGVDTSVEAAGAAVFAAGAAQRVATTCYLVHATNDVLASVPGPEDDRYPYARLNRQACAGVAAALGSRVPASVLETLTVRWGSPAAVLNGAVAALGAELVVLGGKYHSALARWVGGSTSLNVARTTRVPVLVTVGAPAVRRVLVAVDASGAARPTLAAAERYALLFGAELRALSVVEPLPVLPEVPQPDTTDYYRVWEETLAQDVWPLIRAPGVETILRYGVALDAILREAAEWRADLLVVGSHGKGWGKRMLVGSVTERLINHLLTSLLVVPTAVAVVGPEAHLMLPDGTRAAHCSVPAFHGSRASSSP